MIVVQCLKVIEKNLASVLPKDIIYSMIVKLLTEHHLQSLSLKGGYTGSSESTLVKMPHCWKSQALAQIYYRTSKRNGSHLIKGFF